MKALILQENLNKALSLAGKFISNKIQLPILSSFLLEAKEGQLFISASSLEAGVVIRVAAKIEEEGKIAIPARIFGELVFGLPKEKISLTTDGLILKIAGGKHQSTINATSAAEFPAVPQKTTTPQLAFSRKTLIDVAAQVSFAASLDEGRPAITGALVVLSKRDLSFVATDGFRMSLKKVEVQKNTEEEWPPLIIPAKILTEVGKIAQDKEDGAGMIFAPEGNQVLFVWEDVVLSSRLIDGKFPPYEKIIPISATTRIVVDRDELLKSIKLASLFAREGANIIKIKIGGENIKIVANTPQLGGSEKEIEAKIEGEENEIAFN